MKRPGAPDGRHAAAGRPGHSASPPPNSASASIAETTRSASIRPPAVSTPHAWPSSTTIRVTGVSKRNPTLRSSHRRYTASARARRPPRTYQTPKDCSMYGSTVAPAGARPGTKPYRTAGSYSRAVSPAATSRRVHGAGRRSRARPVRGGTGYGSVPRNARSAGSGSSSSGRRVASQTVRPWFITSLQRAPEPVPKAVSRAWLTPPREALGRVTTVPSGKTCRLSGSTGASSTSCSSGSLPVFSARSR